jgi:hypothetical protein
MYYSYIEIEYVAMSFSPARRDLAVKLLTLDFWASGGLYLNDISDPQLLAACSTSSKYNEDNPSFDTARRGPFQAQFWKAMYDELMTLV